MAHVTITDFIDFMLTPKTPKKHYHDQDFTWGGEGSFSISSDQNNYEPDTTHLLTTFRLTPSTSGIDITGIVPGDVRPTGRILIIHNVSVTQALTLKHANTSSTSGNRIECPNDEDYRIGPNASVMLRYGLEGFWRLIDGGYVPLQPFFTTVINELGFNVDWRMEGDNETHLVFLDASADTVGIGGLPPTTGGATDAVLTIINDAANQANMPVLGLVMDDGAANVDDDSLMIQFYGQNDANARVEFARITGVYQDVSAASDAAQFVFSTFVNNALADVLRIGPTAPGNITSQLLVPVGAKALPSIATVAAPTTGIYLSSGIESVVAGVGLLALTATLINFNYDSADIDFQVRGDNNASCMRVDAGRDAVAFGGGVLTGTFMHIQGGTNSRPYVSAIGATIEVPLDTYTDTENTSDAIRINIAFGTPSFDASAAATYADAANVYIEGPATATGNVTITRAYALWVDDGDVRFDGAIELGAATDTTLARASAGDVNIEGNIIYRAGGTDVPVLDGGTGSSTAGGARTNLGLVIGTDVQAEDAVLTDLAALSAVADNEVIVGTGAGTYAHEAATTLPATIGGNIQDLDTLGAIAAKGQIMSASGAGVLAYLSVGTNDQVLTADSAEATGIKWAAAGGGGGTSLAFAFYMGA